MKIKLILSGILFVISNGYGIAQTINSGDWVEMTRTDYEKFVRDSRDLRALKVGYKFLEWENKKQRRKIDSLNRELNELFEIFETLKRENKELQSEVIKERKRAKGYNDLAKELSGRLQVMKKWRGKYYEVATIKIGTVAGVMVISVTAVYFILKYLKKIE